MLYEIGISYRCGSRDWAGEAQKSAGLLAESPGGEQLEAINYSFLVKKIVEGINHNLKSPINQLLVIPFDKRFISMKQITIELIQEYRTTLISDAVTEKIDVRDYAAVRDVTYAS